MPASLPPNGGGAENRRSTRVIHAVPVTIRARDALGQSFEEFTSTVTVNCNGCKYESKHYVPKGSGLTIEIGPRQRGSGSRIFPARVVWVQRPRNYREIFHIAVEFEVPGNVWDIKVPPKDWFPHPDDEELIIPVYPEEGDPVPVVPVLVASVARAQNLETENRVAETAQRFLSRINFANSIGGHDSRSCGFSAVESAGAKDRTANREIERRSGDDRRNRVVARRSRITAPVGSAGNGQISIRAYRPAHFDCSH